MTNFLNWQNVVVNYFKQTFPFPPFKQSMLLWWQYLWSQTFPETILSKNFPSLIKLREVDSGPFEIRQILESLWTRKIPKHDTGISYELRRRNMASPWDLHLLHVVNLFSLKVFPWKCSSKTCFFLKKVLSDWCENYWTFEFTVHYGVLWVWNAQNRFTFLRLV